MSGTYAATTSVTSDKSRAEIEKTLIRYGATSFAYGWQEDAAMIGFKAHDRNIRLVLPMPNRESFVRTPSGRRRSSASEIDKAFDQAVRQKWRALALVIKAKLEAVEAGIVTFEDEFAMHMVLPGGRTVADHVLPAIATAYDTGNVPPLLLIESANINSDKGIRP